MNLNEEKLRKYYTEVAKDLIKDGVTGFSEETLTEQLMSDPDNPFRPLSKEEILHELEISEQQFKEENASHLMKCWRN